MLLLTSFDKDSLVSLPSWARQKKLLLMILQKVLENKNKFERRFVDILSVCIGRSRQYSKESKSYSNRNKISVKLNYSSKILDIINISSLISTRDVKSKIP